MEPNRSFLAARRPEPGLRSLARAPQGVNETQTATLVASVSKPRAL